MYEDKWYCRVAVEAKVDDKICFTVGFKSGLVFKGYSTSQKKDPYLATFRRKTHVLSHLRSMV